jgi:hypothetical protein
MKKCKNDLGAFTCANYFLLRQSPCRGTKAGRRAARCVRLALGTLWLWSCALGMVLAQDIATKGGIRGRVVDTSGAVIPNAKITITGPTGERVTNANEAGEFEVFNLLPGRYTVKAEQTGFKTASVANVDVFVGKVSALKVTLDIGNIAEVVEVVGGAAAVDTSSTAVGSNLSDHLYESLPLPRSVTSLFYLGPGTTDSLRGGRANPSVSGGSALDNLYVADGVNITDSAFGGLGIFSRVYLTLGVGINTSYIKEVQVKTGGFEPQFGQSQGGIVNIITKSGTNEWHGSVFGFSQPQQFEAERRQPDDFSVNKVGKLLHGESYDAGIDIGGPAPGLHKKLFLFGSFNPSIRRDIVRGAEGSGLLKLYGDQTHQRYFTKNYAFKADYNLSSVHQINFSIFGDPTTTNDGVDFNLTPNRSLNIDNTTANSRLDFGTRNIAVRYNGTLTPTWTVSGSFSQGQSRFDESGFANFHQIVDRTQPARGNFTAIGLGFYEPTDGTTYRGSVDTSKQISFLGTHTFGVGYQYQRGFYSGLRERSGPKFTIPATNADGTLQISPTAAGQPTNAAFSLRIPPAGSLCTLCPLLTLPDGSEVRVYLRQDRGEFGVPSFDTQSDYHAAYAQDTWHLNRFVTALLGYRWEQERLIGSPGPSGNRLSYVFTGNWSPRFGITIDPLGRGRTKLYYNFGRFHEYIPLDLAERSLSSEKDFIGAGFAPQFTGDAPNRRAVINPFGTVTPVLDASHLLSGAAGGIATAPTVSAQDPTNAILPGTKLGFAQEHLVGFEQQLPGNLVVSVRYIDRRLERIVEDAAVVSPEGAAFFGQTYFIGNISSTLDAAVNPIAFKYPVGAPLPTQCNPDLATEVFDHTGKSLGMVCYATLGKNGKPAGDPGADGVPDGFPDPVHNYRAVEIELNKRFSKNWQLISNWRIAKLQGNFEGHFRNDNGQTDPAISSLFDFTAGDFGLLGDQFAVGPLNTDRKHIVNIYGSYAFGDTALGRKVRGLNLGGGLHMESGVPISEFLAHPVYLNMGEIPVGGRGKLGRTAFYTGLDLHVNYPWSLGERLKLSTIADFFNVTNNRRVRLPNQNRESTAGQLNPDFGQPFYFHTPFSMRLGVKLEF